MYEEDSFNKDSMQFVPLNVLDSEIQSTGYFTSNKKWITISMWFLVYPIILFVVLQLKLPFIIAIVLFVIYTIIYSYILRYKVLEEGRLKEQLKDMEQNQIGEISYFYGIDKVGDDGRLFYRKNSFGNKIFHGYIVTYEKGSIVNVPKGHLEKYRFTKISFLNKIHRAKYGFRWYEVGKKTGLSKGLKYYNEVLEKIPNPLAQKVISSNITNISDATLLSESRYKDYIIVVNTSTNQLREIRNNLENIIRTTLGTNNYIKAPHILDKKEVAEFFENYYMQDTINLETAMTLSKNEDFSKFAIVKNLYDLNGKLVPMEVINEVYESQGHTNTELSLESLLQNSKELTENQERQRLIKMQRELDDVLRDRNKEIIGDDEYIEKREAIMEKYDKKNYDPDYDKNKRKRLSEEAELEKKAKKLALEERRKREEEIKKAQAVGKDIENKKWYDDNKSVNIFDLIDAKAEKSIEDISIEDLLGLSASDEEEK